MLHNNLCGYLVVGWMKSSLKDIIRSPLQQILQDSQLFAIEAGHISGLPLSAKPVEE